MRMFLAIKCFWWNAGHADLLNQIMRKLQRCPIEHIREVCHNKVGSLWDNVFESATIEGIHHDLELGPIHCLELLIVAIRQTKRVGYCVLRWMMNREGNELVRTRHTFHKIGMPIYPSNLPSSGVERFPR